MLNLKKRVEEHYHTMVGQHPDPKIDSERIDRVVKLVESKVAEDKAITRRLQTMMTTSTMQVIREAVKAKKAAPAAEKKA